MERFCIFSLMLAFSILSCSKDDSNNQQDPTENEEMNEEPNQEKDLYFPPLDSDDWETVSLIDLDWNTDAEQGLYDLLEESDSKAFIILKDGKIAIEWYADDFTRDSPWYWASAGKTLTSFTTGIAEQEGYLKLTDKTSDYLGEGWTSAPPEKESLISIWNQLTMTAGLDDTVAECMTSECLHYVSDAGTRWSYHNRPYTLIQNVISDATQTDFESYFATKLKNRIGMTGSWLPSGEASNTYWSTARSMARFGLLNLNDGIWDDTVIMDNESFINAAKNTSQELNKSYGYLWWLNGKQSTMIPQSQTVFNGELIPNAPDDVYAGLGKNDQKLYIVPSANMVVVRMGQDGGIVVAGPSSYDNRLWEAINLVVE